VRAPLEGEVGITVAASDTLVEIPDDGGVVDTNNLASALALTLSASELSGNSLKKFKF
jgi:hypothetical protein